MRYESTLAGAPKLTHRHPRCHTPLRLDITDPASVEAAAAGMGDLDILINNAGISTDAPLLGTSLENIRREFDTNFWGTLAVTRAFAPRLAGGAILNVISALSW